jgi:MinD-like ATPase involved in chromosome partitioning or flagellar assembly
MSKIISVYSCRSGTGQSNFLANLAVSIAQSGHRVGIVDADSQAPGIHALFGLDNDRIDQVWNSCLQKASALQDPTVAQKGELAIEQSYPFLSYDQGEIALISGGVALPSAQVRVQDIAGLLHQGYDIDRLNQGFLELIQLLHLDYLLIDTHPGLTEETLFSLALSDVLVLVLGLNQQEFQGLAVTVDVAHTLGIPEIVLVASQVNNSLETIALKHQLEQTYQETVVGVLPFCEEMLLLGSRDLFCLQYPNHSFTAEVQTIAQRITELKPNHHTIALKLQNMACGLPEPSQKIGLSMAELVDLPAPQRQLIAWMMRKGHITLSEAVSYTNQTEIEIQAILGTLIQQGFIQTYLSSGETYYQLRLAPKRGSRISEKLWEL